MSRKGLLRGIFGCCFPGKQERRGSPPVSGQHCIALSPTSQPDTTKIVTPRPALSSQTAPQYLQVKGLTLSSGSSQQPNYKGSCQQDGIGDSPLLGCQEGAETRCPAAKSCCSPSTPRDNPSTSLEKPGQE